MDKELKDLIFGKDSTRRIVSIEPSENGECEIFRELEDGTIKSEIVPFKPYILFTKPLQPNFHQLKGNQEYKFYREYGSTQQYYDVLSKCSKKNIDVYTVRDQKEACMIRHGYTYYKGMSPKDVSTLSIDIEDTYGIANEPRDSGKMLLIANTFRKNGKIERKQFAYDEYVNEYEMLRAWSKWVRQRDPSIILGHNLYGHDLKVINFAAKRLNLKLKLGRNKSEMYVKKRESQFRKDGSQSYSYNNILIYGREIVDTWFLAMKYDAASRREYENFKLKYIIKAEGLEKEDRVHYDAANIERDYKDPEKWKLIKQYNIDDSDDPLNYFDKVIPVFFQYSKSLPRSFQAMVNSATGSQVNSLLVRAYLQQGRAIPRGSEAIKYPGAISFGMPGLHRNVFKVDVASLYPSIILSKHLTDKKKDPKEYMLKMLRYFTDERLRNKDLYEKTGNIWYKILSDSQKIVINSIYGFYGAPRLNFNCPRIAAKVTEVGREILMTALEWATGKREVPEGALGNKVNTTGEEL